MQSFISADADKLFGMLCQFMIGGDVSSDQIEAMIGGLRPMFPSLSDADIDQIRKLAIERHGLTVHAGAMISKGFRPWLDRQRRTNIDWHFWERYRRHVATKISPASVASLDKTTDRLLELCVDPLTKESEDRRGMGLGDVQSGKTAHYTGLISKAADCGYKVFIVIAGIHENLRSQTQKRLNEAFCGWNGEERIGVGLEPGAKLVTSFTKRESDFRKADARDLGIHLDNLEGPVIFVVKKNPTVLKTLISWIRSELRRSGRDQLEAPLLLIDDEADNASINIAKGPNAVSRINGAIRDILGLFERRTYVAYTATPFANIFIEPRVHLVHGRDLFPENFIVTLDRPSEYVGAAKVFGVDDDLAPSPVRIIRDRNPHLPARMRKSDSVDDVPGSLLDAMRAFLISKAVRTLRGETDFHHSMLINVSHLTEIQEKVAARVLDHLLRMKETIAVHAGLPQQQALRDLEMRNFRRVFDEEFARCGSSWDEIQGSLYEASKDCQVVSENSKSADRLIYDDKNKLTVIAVGGFALGRGLTLEGLTTSYILRNSKAYDTLLQMGRWFGYRPGYEDLCRIWMTSESWGWYAFIAEASEELRLEIMRMEKSGLSPEDFGLKVRSHPASLEVTARNKMGSAKAVTVSVDLAGRMPETTVVFADPAPAALTNRKAAIALAQALMVRGGPSEQIGTTTGWMHRRVSSAHVLHFLRGWQNHERSSLTQIKPIIRHIEDRPDELEEWDVAFIGVGDDEEGPLWSGLGRDIRCQVRTPEKRTDEFVVAQRRRFSSRGVTRIGMTDEEITAARDSFLQENPGKKNVSDSAYCEERTRPLLAVHMIALRGENEEIDTTPITVWTTAFPKSKDGGETVQYIANTRWLSENEDDDRVDDDEREYEEG